LLKLGYRCLHRSADAANYARGDERIAFVYARRPIARHLLADAVDMATALGELRVVSAEGLIGFKFMAAVEALCPVWPRRVFAEGARMLM